MNTFIPFTSDDEIVAIGHGLLRRTLPKTDWTYAFCRPIRFLIYHDKS
jgi:hypothetical protein